MRRFIKGEQDAREFTITGRPKIPWSGRLGQTLPCFAFMVYSPPLSEDFRRTLIRKMTYSVSGSALESARDSGGEVLGMLQAKHTWSCFCKGELKLKINNYRLSYPFLCEKAHSGYCRRKDQSKFRQHTFVPTYKRRLNLIIWLWVISMVDPDLREGFEKRVRWKIGEAACWLAGLIGFEVRSNYMFRAQ